MRSGALNGHGNGLYYPSATELAGCWQLSSSKASLLNPCHAHLCISDCAHLMEQLLSDPGPVPFPRFRPGRWGAAPHWIKG